MSTAATTSITLIDSRSTSLTVTWPSTEGACRYILSYQSISSNSTTADSETTVVVGDFETLSSRLTQTQARKKNLSPSTRYLFRVAAVLEDGDDDPPKKVGPWTTHETSFSTLSLEEEGKCMAAPAVADAWSNRALIVSWTAVVGEGASSSSYCIQMRKNKGGSIWTTISASFSGTQVKKKNLHSPLGYQFRVRPSSHDDEDDTSIPYSPPSEIAIARGLSPGIQQFFSQMDDAHNPTLLRSGNPTPIPLADALGGKEFILIYVSAHWCPPCRKFTPQLANWYRLHRERVEVVFLSCDHDAAGFDGYFASQPWMAVGYEDGGREKIQATMRVSGIPQLMVLSGRTGVVIDNNAVGKQLDLAQWRLVDR